MLAEPFQKSLPAVSKHFKALERAGLISRGHEAQWRPARLEIDPFREAADWIQQYVVPEQWCFLSAIGFNPRLPCAADSRWLRLSVDSSPR